MDKFLSWLNFISNVLTESELNAYLYAHYSTIDNYGIARQIGVSINEICSIINSANKKVDSAVMNIAIQDQIKANINFCNSAKNMFCENTRSFRF